MFVRFAAGLQLRGGENVARMILTSKLIIPKLKERVDGARVVSMSAVAKPPL
jgi:hypothetical protein